MKKFFLIIIVFAVSFFLSIEYIGDKLIKNRLEKNISSELNRDVSIDKLNIDYLSGKADMRGFSILNKEYDGYLLRIETISIDLDTFSLFSDNIVINNVLLENIRSFERDIKKNTSQSQSNKYFNIKNLDTKNISISMMSSNLDIEKTFKLQNINLKNIGNTDQSNNYKDVLKKIFNDTIDKIKEKFSIEDFLNNVENFDTEKLENKVKDKLKNKLKNLIN